MFVTVYFGIAIGSVRVASPTPRRVLPEEHPTPDPGHLGFADYDRTHAMLETVGPPGPIHGMVESRSLHAGSIWRKGRVTKVWEERPSSATVCGKNVS